MLVVQRGEKKCLVIDYSTTINQYTALDAYSLPRIEELVNKIACDEYYNSIDLRAAYHQVPLVIIIKNNLPRFQLMTEDSILNFCLCICV